MNILSFTTLYPNAAQPEHGIFVENRLKRLAAQPEVRLDVIAPVPWFPLRSGLFGRYGAYARAPRQENRYGIGIVHPRYPLIPKLGMTSAPRLLALGTKAALANWIRKNGRPDLIDAHYFYPDGVAAVRLGAAFGIPVTITARGTDLNLIPRYAGPRRQIAEAAAKAAALITVCDALRAPLVDMGVASSRITTLRNGVDLEVFSPGNREEMAGFWPAEVRIRLLSVGGLVERKGHHLIIEALRQVPEAGLVIVGSGPERNRLIALARRLGVEQQVRLAGQVGHEALPALYRAADMLVLASSREGWANVLLEAMACGTPVVATGIWGTPEVVAAPEAGLLVERRTASIAQGVTTLFGNLPERSATRAYAEQFSWDETITGLMRVFGAIVQE